MDGERLKAVLESLLFAAGEPVPLARLVTTLEDVPREEVRRALTELGADCNREGRGVVLVEIAGGYQFRTAKEHAPYVRKLLAARPPRLSRPILETLAIIAYRQPVTRPEIEQLRGVDSGAVLDTLIERQLVRVAGRKEAPGRPQLYATTVEFLETFGLKDLDALPDLSELREVEQQIEAAGLRREAETAEIPSGDEGREAGESAAASVGEAQTEDTGNDVIENPGEAAAQSRGDTADSAEASTGIANEAATDARGESATGRAVEVAEAEIDASTQAANRPAVEAPPDAPDTDGTPRIDRGGEHSPTPAPDGRASDGADWAAPSERPDNTGRKPED